MAGIASICDSEHMGREEHHLPLKDIPGVLGIHCRGRDEGEEKGLYCSLVGWMALDLNCWRSCLLEVSNAIYIGSHAEERSVFFVSALQM